MVLTIEGSAVDGDVSYPSSFSVSFLAMANRAVSFDEAVSRAYRGAVAWRLLGLQAV